MTEPLLYGFTLDAGQQHPFDGSSRTSLPFWLHFDYTHPDTPDLIEPWLSDCGVNPDLVIHALTDEDTRPRASIMGKGVFVSLRGVNLSNDATPDDMVSIRLYVTEQFVISSRRRKLLSVRQIVEDLQEQRGPTTPAAFLTRLISNLSYNMAETIANFEDSLADYEEQELTHPSVEERQNLAQLRRQVIAIRRYLAPQRDALFQLQSERFDILNSEQKLELRESQNHLIRYIEELDVIDERAALLQEAISNQVAEQMNKRMYVLSIISIIFLPLGFLTGLLGVNLAGIPGSESSTGFTIFSILLVLVIVLQVWLLKRFKWF